MRLPSIALVTAALMTAGLGAPHTAQAPAGTAAARLAAARTAMGGAAKLSAVKTLLLKGEEKVVSESLDMKTGRASTTYPSHPLEVRAMLPDRYLHTVEVQLGSQPAQQGSFGFSGPDLLCTCFKRPEALDLYRQTFAEMMLLLLLRTDTASPLTIDTTPGSGLALEFTAAQDIHMRLDLDPASRLPARLRFKRPDRTRTLELTGKVSDVVISADDYHIVSGLRLPSHFVETVNGEFFTETRYASILINPALTPADFKK